jgi:DNA-binding beta-propeller fold protein YncE
VGTFPVGSGPVGVCTDAQHVWVANDGDGSVTELDAGTGSAIRMIAGLVFPDAISCDGNEVWVANDGNGTVTEINASSGAIASTYAVGSNPDAISADGSAVWVANANDGTVSQLVDGPPAPPGIDSAHVTGATTARVDFSPPADNGTGLVTSYTVTATDVTTPGNGGQTVTGPESPLTVGGLTTGDTYSFRVTAANAAGSGAASDTSNAVTPSSLYVRTAAVGEGPLAVSADGTHVWVANTNDEVSFDSHGTPISTVTELDADGSFVRSIDVAFLPDAISSDGTHVWVASEGYAPFTGDSVVGNVVTEIDASTGEVVQEVTVGGDHANLGGISSDGTHVWVSDFGEDSVIELDASDASVVRTIDVGNGPTGISSDGTHAWVANSGLNEDPDGEVVPGTVSEIETSTGDVVATIDGFDGPWAVAADGTHVWVTDAGQAGPGQPGGGHGLTEVDAATGETVGTVTVGADPLGVSSDGTYVWVSNRADDTVAQVAASTGDLVRTTPVGSNPYGISSDGTHAWVTNVADDTVLELGIEP